MAKTSWNDYSATAASNTDVDSVNIDEGCAPSGINNAIRELMAHTADVVAGTTALSSINIDGGSITGITDLAVADGGTGASTASGARTNLGLGSIATQDSSSVTITGGSISGITSLTVDTVTAKTTNSNLTLTGNGTGKVAIGDGSLIMPDADGSAGQFIKTDGSGNLSFDTPSSGSDFLGELDGTSVTTVTITDLDLTPYKIVMMQLVNCDPNTSTNDGGAYLRMTISSDNGSTFISTGYTGGNGNRDVQAENVDNGAYWPICPWPGRLSNISGNVFFTGLGNASEDKVYSGSILAKDTSSPYQFPIVPAGSSSSTAVIDAIKVYSTLRNIGGTVRFYGIR